MKLSNRVAIVSAAGRGIGKAIAARLLEDGATVIAVGSKPEGPPPAGCEYLAADFSDSDASREFADVVAGLGVDILTRTVQIAPSSRALVKLFTRISSSAMMAPL